MTDYRNQGIRQRIMTYSSGPEIDYVCTACLTIVLDGVTCQHCQASAQKIAQRIEKLKGQQRAFATTDAGELDLFAGSKEATS